MEFGAGQSDRVPPGEAPTGRGAHCLPVQQATPGTGSTIVEHLVTLEGKERRETGVSSKGHPPGPRRVPAKGSPLHNQKCSLSQRNSSSPPLPWQAPSSSFSHSTSQEGLLWSQAEETTKILACVRNCFTHAPTPRQSLDPWNALSYPVPKATTFIQKIQLHRPQFKIPHTTHKLISHPPNKKR